MDRKIILKEITRLFETLQEQTEILNQYEGSIPQIEIDIILKNIRDCYEKVRELGSLKMVAVVQEQSISELPPVQEKPNTAMLPNIPVTEKDVQEFKKTMLVESMSQYNLSAEKVIPEEDREVLPAAEIPHKKSKPLKKTSPDLFTTENTVGDQFRDEKKSLNERLTAISDDNSLASKLKKNPVKDLKNAIGINEKFMFINELFEGSLQKYNEHINLLNSLKSKEDADNHMASLSGEFSWKKESDAVNTLSDLVARRFL